MPWQLTYQQDTDVLGVGTVSAVFTDDSGAVVATHSGRVDTTSGDGLDTFIDLALTTLNTEQSKHAERNAVLAKISAVLNEKVQ